MPVNPGDRFPAPSVVERATDEIARATRGTIVYFQPILDGLLVLLAVALAFSGLPLFALVVAYAAGRVGVR